MADIPSAYAQGAKIQRKTAKLTVQPQLVVRGNAVNAVVQTYDDRVLLRVTLTRPDGEVLDRLQLTGDSPVFSAQLTAPEGTSGRVRVVLEERVGLNWTPAASEEAQLLPNYWSELSVLVGRAEKVEREAAESNPALLRAAWAVLAYAEDLKERVKLSEVGQAWDVQRRLTALKSKTEALESGKDPYATVTGYQLRGYRSAFNGEIQLYSVYVPKGYGIDPQQKWPMAVMLHGAFSNHHLALRRVVGLTNNRAENDAAAKRFMPSLPDLPYIVVAPNGFETGWYKGYAEEDVWRVLNEMESAFSIDANRVYLTGLSMGGGGTARLGLTYPDRFAALAPVCGFVDEFLLDPSGNTPEYVKRFIRAKMPIEQAENAFQLPVKSMHGEADPIVPVRNSIELNQKLNDLGYRSEIETYPGVGHDAWVNAYKDARIFEWFSQFERNPFPKEVVYKTGYPTGGSSYWVRVDEPMKIRRLARIDAKIDGNAVAVKTDNIQVFSLRVPKELIARESVATVSVDGKAIYTGTLGDVIRFQHADGAWKQTREEIAPRLLPSYEGLYGALEEKHVVVFGDSGTSDENEAAQTIANAKSLPGPWVDALFPVMPESALTPELLKDNHVVLYSTLNGSSFLKNHLSLLPIKVEADRIELAGRIVEPDQAIAFIYPNPANSDKYLTVCASATVDGLKAVGSLNATPETLFENAPGDFVVIGKDGKLAWGGLFDKDWNVDEVGEF